MKPSRSPSITAVMLPVLLLSLMTTVISLIMFVQLRSNGLRFVNSATTTVWFLLLMMYVPVSVLTLPAQTIITALRQTLSVFVRHLQTAIICLAFAVRNI